MEHWNLFALNVAHRSPQVLHSARGVARSIVVQLPAGEGLPEHQVHETTYVMVVEGEIVVEQDGEQVTGTTGFMAVLGAAERHAIRATRETRLLLVLAPWPGDGHPGARDD